MQLQQSPVSRGMAVISLDFVLSPSACPRVGNAEAQALTRWIACTPGCRGSGAPFCRLWPRPSRAQIGHRLAPLHEALLAVPGPREHTAEGVVRRDSVKSKKRRNHWSPCSCRHLHGLNPRSPRHDDGADGYGDDVQQLACQVMGRVALPMVLRRVMELMDARTLLLISIHWS